MLHRSTAVARIFQPSVAFLCHFGGQKGIDNVLFRHNSHYKPQDTQDIKGAWSEPIAVVNADITDVPISLGTRNKNDTRESIFEVQSHQPLSSFSEGSSGAALLSGEKRVVTMRESSAEGVYIMEINNPPVNTLTLPVMRQMLEYLRWAAETYDEAITSLHKNGPQRTYSKPHPCITYLSEKNGLPSPKDKFPVPRGIILTSLVKNVFSAGLDLNELLAVHPKYNNQTSIINDKDNTAEKAVQSDGIPGYGRFVEYWCIFQELWYTLHTFPLPIVAAINGDAPAGGCILAMCCDYRVMAVSEAHSENSDNKTPSEIVDRKQRQSNTTEESSLTTPDAQDKSLQHSLRKYRIGITATRAGFTVPPFVVETVRYVVGSRKAELVLQCGKLIQAEEAFMSYPSLVDALSDSSDTVLRDAIRIMVAGFIKGVPFDHTRWLVKDHCRGKLVSMLDSKEKRLKDVSDSINMFRRDEVYENLMKYKKSLTKS
eukprot:Tbor_TRINITY_DN5291_c0_g1::TRINITY_DN5291_c0_g1_i1::g.16464::m.16464/K13238/DCI; 3,2-trans-enoyl-CoA isomerase, mitochondrial